VIANFVSIPDVFVDRDRVAIDDQIVAFGFRDAAIVGTVVAHPRDDGDVLAFNCAGYIWGAGATAEDHAQADNDEFANEGEEVVQSFHTRFLSITRASPVRALAQTCIR
jgi:hypothetical protein